MKVRIRNLLTHAFMMVVSFFAIFPFLWMLSGITNSNADILSGRMGIGDKLIENFSNLTRLIDLQGTLINSLIIALVGTLLTLLLTSMAGYGFEIFRSPAKSKLFNILILSMMMPFSALMIPLFKMFMYTKMGNTLTAAILPMVSTAYMIFFFMQNTKTFPREILQASRIDGLSDVQSFFRIYMPTMKATYSAGAIITFMAYWNSYLWPLVILQTENKKTLPLVMAGLSSSYNPDYGVIMMAIVITTIPSLLLFFLMQKNFVEGMLGSVK